MKPAYVKKLLLSKIKDVSDDYKNYTLSPEKDFTRARKLSFRDVVTCIIGMGGGSLRNELIDFWDYSPNMATSSAFVQQRYKIKPEAFKNIFMDFSAQIVHPKNIRLLAVDGTDLHIPTNIDDVDTLFVKKNCQKPFNLLHLNALYDLDEKIYVDALIQKRRKSNEHRALTEMVDRSDIVQAIVIADRGYESYNNMAHIQEKGWKFLIRVKEEKAGICCGLELPKDSCFDIKVKLSLTRKQTNETKTLFKNKNSYKLMPASCIFDYLPEKCKKNDPALFFKLAFRIVRFKITDDSYETIVTNLDKTSYPPERIKELYSMRWGIETSFRDLKYTVGLSNFHTRKVMCIEQEIFARLTMYNFVEMITSHVVINEKPRQYTYKANFAVAVHMCRDFFAGKTTSPCVEAIIANNTVPIRPNRHCLRKVGTRAFVGFLYRVA